MNDLQLLRYSRHILLPQIDVQGQEKLLHSSVLIIGLGGLGSPVAMYLAAAGVGHLYLCDFDKVSLSNLQRQIIHTTQNIGQYKVDSAYETLLALNPDVKITRLYQQIEENSLTQYIQDIDIIVDCTDNLHARLTINKICVSAKKPLVTAAAIRMEGQLTVFLNNNQDSPCYQCIYTMQQAQEETCAENGILSPMAGLIGSLQALETLKIIMNVGQTLEGKLLLFDALNMEWLTLKLSRNPHCPLHET